MPKGGDRSTTSTKPRCIARRSNGDPCRNFPILGGSVCRFHGGGAPQVKAMAQERIMFAADLAAQKLIELIRAPRVPARDKVQAINSLLDRAGITTRQEIAVTVSKFEELIEGAVIDFDLTMPTAIEAAHDEDVVDAVIVPDKPTGTVPVTRRKKLSS